MNRIFKTLHVRSHWEKCSTIFLLCVTCFLGCPVLSASAHNPKSIYRIDPSIDGSIIGLSAITAVLPLVFAERLIPQKCPCDPAEVNSLDRRVIGNSNDSMGKFSDVLVGLSLMTPLVVDWVHLDDRRVFFEDLVVYAEALSINYALNAWIKVAVHRPLPRTYAGDPHLTHSPSGYRSFYSGHVSTAFAALSTAAITMNLRKHSGMWPWLVVAGVGVGTAAGRIAAGRHFYTDTFAGAAAGIAVGTLVPLLHHWNQSRSVTVQFIPLPRGGQLAWNWKFH